MKKTSFIIITVFITTITLICSIYTDIKEESIKIGNFSTDRLNENLINDYLVSKGDKKKELEKHIKEVVLKDMELDKWLEYEEYIKVIVYPIDIIDNSEKDLIIGLNLSKNLGIIGVYKLKESNYILKDKIENLATIEKLSVKKNNSSDKRFLLVEEYLDERVGAYFTDKFIRVFSKESDDFEEVFRHSINYEAYYYEKWLDADIKDPKWFKLKEESIIDYETKIDKNPTIVVSKDIRKFEGINSLSTDIPSEFKEIVHESIELKHYFNEEYKRFILSKGEVIKTAEKVAILEDMSKSVDYLLNLGDKYYKVINKNMKIKYIKHEELKIDDL